MLDDLQQLIMLCAQNDRHSQEKLYRKLYPSMFILCKRFFADNHEALETLNDGMMKVFRNIEKYDRDKGDFFNWIYTVVRNTALDKIKLSKAPITEEIKEADEWADGGNMMASLEWKDTFRLLDVLSPATRVVCSLFYLEGFSVKEIGERLETSQGTVKWHLSEARKKLKKAASIIFEYKI